MALFKSFRGKRENLDEQELHDGYAYFCTDDGSLHIDFIDEDGNLQRKQISAKGAETLDGGSEVLVLDDIADLPKDIKDGTIVVVPTETNNDGDENSSALVQPDYNQNDSEQPDYIKNRPFYEESFTGEITLEFDGDLNGKEAVDLGGSDIYVKVSDIALTPTELENATYDVYDSESGVVAQLAASDVTDMSGDTGVESYIAGGTYGVRNTNFVFSLFEDIPEIGFTAGLWFIYQRSDNDRFNYTQSMSYTGTISNIKKVDEKFLPEHSWNNLKDRPFYEETVTGEVVIEYGGDSTGKVVVPMGDTQLVKVSDLTPEPSELIGGTATMGEDSMTITADVIEDARPAMPGVAVGDGMLMICYEPIPAYGITEAGMYLVDMGVAASLTYTGTVTNIKKLDPKFLEFSKVSDTPIVDETVTNDYSFTNSFAVVVGDTYLVEYDGTRYFCVAKTLTVGDVFVTYLGNADAVGLEDTGEPFIIYNTEEKWILGTKSSTPDHSIKIYHVECAKIPKECLPEDIGGDCGLPEVTEADNGKFLQVVDGAYALVALTDVSLEGA